MSKFTPRRINLNSINGGNRYGYEGISPEAVNAPIEASAYAQDLSEEAKTLATTALDRINDAQAGSISLSAYPVGSIYMSVNATSPAQLFGGTWERLKDKFLLGVGDIYSAGATGGEAMHTLTIEEMPTHTHGATYTNSADNKIYGWLATTTSNSGENIGFQAIYAGNGNSHNNMPPYLAVYMWKRIA